MVMVGGAGSGSFVTPHMSISRTESVAEKMLTNWFTFLLYKFLKVGRLERRQHQGGCRGYERNRKPEMDGPVVAQDWGLSMDSPMTCTHWPLSCLCMRLSRPQSRSWMPQF